MTVDMSMGNSGHNIEIDKINKIEWEGLLPQFNDATIYQTWSYGAVRWGEKNLSHVVLKKDNQVVGLAQLTIMKVPIIKAGIAYIPWGPLWRKKGNEDSAENFESIIRALRDEYVSKQGLFLRMTPHIMDGEKSKEACAILVNEGFKKNIFASEYRTLIVDLSPPLQEIRKKFNPKWRNKLSGAEKNGLHIIEGNSMDLYRVFQELQKEMQARKEYVPGVDYDEFGMIQKELPEHLKMKIMVCEYNSEPIAAAIVSAIGSMGIYLLGATGSKWSNLKGSYFIHWRMMSWLKEQGYSLYDLGGINPAANPGVYTFKVGFPGSDVHHIGQFEKCNNLLSAFCLKIGEKYDKSHKKAQKSKF
jgi:lipid II:glycine glycyltransferase (peptidoglycan interpeptide bridge formation enzyme)